MSTRVVLRKRNSVPVRLPDQVRCFTGSECPQLCGRLSVTLCLAHKDNKNLGPNCPQIVTFLGTKDLGGRVAEDLELEVLFQSDLCRFGKIEFRLRVQENNFSLHQFLTMHEHMLFSPQSRWRNSGPAFLSVRFSAPGAVRGVFDVPKVGLE